MNLDIQVVDVSARDGLQNEPNAASLSADAKVDYIEKLVALGLKRIEAGSFVHPRVVAMANSGEVASLLRPVQAKYPEVIFSYLVPNLKGLERAKSVQAREVAIFLAMSEKFAKANINAPSVEQSFLDIRPVVAAAAASGMRVRGYLSSVFGYDDLPFSPEAVAKRSEQLLQMGCFEVSLGDTTGIGTVEQVEALIATLNTANVPLAKVAMHFHDTFGNAIKNVDRSYALGIRTFDAATGGLGGCPYANSPKGNLAMEDLVRWCHGRGMRCDVTDEKALAQAGAFMRAKLGKA